MAELKQRFNDISAYAVNVLPRHAAGFPYDADGNEKAVCLNGKWKFKFLTTVNDIPADYYLTENDNADFDLIDVPSEWQIKGYDTPIYTNINYPYAIKSKGKMPYIYPEKNSCGLYVTYFDVEKKDGFRYKINFGGINSAGEVYVNGSFVGFSQDTFDETEYDVTEFVKSGKNKLAVTVYRYCTGSYLEDQDMWRLSGIFRDVYLIEEPLVRVSDVFVRSEIEDDEVYLKLDVSFAAPTAFRGKLSAVLHDGAKVVATFEKMVDVPAGGTQTLRFARDVKNVKLWSNEVPYLYELDIKLFTRSGVFVDARKINHGFRQTKIQPMKDGRGPFVTLNGKPIKFYGVNRHEFHPEYGHAVPYAITEEDIKLCKRNNITAIRTSHYPNSRRFYDLCDRYGILVMCENNLETHGLATKIPRSNPKWTKQCVYRMTNMVSSYKNHACIGFWSLGNESGNGGAFAAMRAAALAIDDTRPIHYEPDAQLKNSDLFSEMYTHHGKMPKIGQNKSVIHSRSTWNAMMGYPLLASKYKNKPFMLCEYAHCMGNSLGNFKEYWDEFYRYDRLAGGFIWDFADQGIATKNEDGSIKYNYGGDFGDKPNDNRFAFNGIVRGDRSPNPALYEVKKVYQPIRFELTPNALRLTNLYNFRDLSKCKLTIRFYDDGRLVDEREGSLEGLAAKKSLDVFYVAPAVEGEGVMKAEVTEPATAYSEDGHVLAEESFVYGAFNYNAHYLYAQGKPSAYDDGMKIHITGVDFAAEVDKKTGGITSITRLGKELLKSPVMPNFCRATIDNDAVPQVPEFVGEVLGASRFKKATAALSPKSVTLDETNNEVTVEINWKMPHMKYVKTKYSFYLNGGVRLDLQAESAVFNMERYGFKFELDPEMTNMEFYGKGPHENYCDRAYSAELGIYSGAPGEFMHDYLYPQENGCRTGVRWLTLSGGDLSLKVLAVNKEIQTTVHAYTQKELDEAKHACELKKGKNLTVYVDGGQRGVGGDTPAVACLNEKYKLKAGVPFSTSFIMFFENKEEYAYEAEVKNDGANEVAEPVVTSDESVNIEPQTVTDAE